MDTTATAKQLLKRQKFRFSTINPTVMSVGKQDSPNLLTWGVGGSLSGSPTNKDVVSERIDIAAGPADFLVPREMILCCFCKECPHQEQ